MGNLAKYLKSSVIFSILLSKFSINARKVIQTGSSLDEDFTGVVIINILKEIIDIYAKKL